MYVYVAMCMYIHILYIHTSSEDHLPECIQIPVTSPHISLLLQCEQILISHLEDGNSLLTDLPVPTLILLCLFSTYQSQGFLKRQVRSYKLDHTPLFQYPPMASNLSPSKGKSWQWPTMSPPYCSDPICNGSSLTSWLWTCKAGSCPSLLSQAPGVPGSSHLSICPRSYLRLLSVDHH